MNEKILTFTKVESVEDFLNKTKKYQFVYAKKGHTMPLVIEVPFESYEKMVLELHRFGIRGERKVGKTGAVTVFEITN